MNEQLDRDLHLMLSRADRASTLTDGDVRQLADAMVRTTIEKSGNARRHLSLAGVLLIPVLALSTAGAAFAAATIDWERFWQSPAEWQGWALTPDAAFSYDLPGGGTCEIRVGDVSFSPDPDKPGDVAADAGSADAARDFLRSADLPTQIDVDQALEALRDVPLTYEDDGWSIPFGFGTENYDADVEYNLAVKDALYTAVVDHVRAAGLSTTGLAFSSQERCVEEQR